MKKFELSMSLHQAVLLKEIIDDEIHKYRVFLPTRKLGKSMAYKLFTEIKKDLDKELKKYD